MSTWLGRTSAVAAVMFGLLVGANLVFAALGDTRDDQMVARVLVGGSSVLCVGGGAMFLFGVERRPGQTGQSLRIAGWILFSAGLLLPTSLVFFQIAAIIGGGIGALRRVRDEQPVDLQTPRQRRIGP